MKSDEKYIDLEKIDKQSKAFFSCGTFHWKQSKEDIWALIEARIGLQQTTRHLLRSSAITYWTVAAVFVFLVGSGFFLRFYSIEVQTPTGQHSVVELPDHSKIDLNAQSKISYYPLWWKISRIVKLDGEAFFNVQKGNSFKVISTKGITQVVGTSFNIYSRDGSYKVTCVTGRVKVKSKAGFSTILKPNTKAEVQADGKINVLENIETYPEISWKKNIFLFTASPVPLVFKEIERQYGVHIESKVDQTILYTGNFTKDQNVEEILEYVCPALELKYIRKSEGEYVIVQKKGE